jgi:hypothetical protein
MLTRIKDVSEDKKMQKLILLKNKHFFGNEPDKSVSNAIFFWDRFVPIFVFKCIYRRFMEIFFEQFGEEQWQY